MAAPKGNKFAKNSKGGGRPSVINEELRGKAVNASWELIYDFLTGEKQPEKVTREEIALELAKKTAPKEVKGDLDLNGSLIIKWQNE